MKQLGTRGMVIIALAVAVVGLIVGGVLWGLDHRIERGLRLEYAIDLDAVPDRVAARDEALNVIRERLDRSGVELVAVVHRGEQIIVELVGFDPARLEHLKARIARSAKLELKLVVDGSRLMASIADHVNTSPDAAGMGIETDKDRWHPDAGGPPHHDIFLRGENRSTLEQFLRGLGQADAALTPAPDQQFGYEYLAPPGLGRRGWWRTYLLERVARLDSRSIRDAMMTLDPVTDQPKVLIELDRAGREAFAELTRENVGKKLAMILDDTIKVAPIINEAITGGRLEVNLGNGERDLDVRDLVAALKAGSLPAPLFLQAATEFDLPPSSVLAHAWMFFVTAAVLALGLVTYVVVTRKH